MTDAAPYGITSPQQIPPSTLVRGLFNLFYKRSSTCSRAFNTHKFVLASESSKISNTKSAEYRPMAIDL